MSQGSKGEDGNKGAQGPLGDKGVSKSQVNHNTD